MSATVLHDDKLAQASILQTQKCLQRFGGSACQSLMLTTFRRRHFHFFLSRTTLNSSSKTLHARETGYFTHHLDGFAGDDGFDDVGLAGWS
jgi:hypothetical protein